MQPSLTNRLIWLDLETTHKDPMEARICSMCLGIFDPGREPKYWTSLVNPTIRIPHEATHGNGAGYPGHGITDEMVADKPTFAQLQKNILKGLLNDGKPADVAGYCIARFDIPVLKREFGRCGEIWRHRGKTIDVYKLWQLLEPRTLSDACRRWLGRTMTSAHTADADIRTTEEIFVSMLEHRSDMLPADVDALHLVQFPNAAAYYTDDGKFIWENGEVVINFGKHKGRRLQELADEYKDKKGKSYIGWFLKNKLPVDIAMDETLQIFQEATHGIVPTR